jgi:hypothetical protein
MDKTIVQGPFLWSDGIRLTIKMTSFDQPTGM